MLKAVSRNIDLANENAYQAEVRGDYREGLEYLSFFWNFEQPEAVPFEDFKDLEFADIILRIGALYGFYGVSKPKAQETSKNFLTVAYNLFDKYSITDKSASCANYIALAYWRMGETREAQPWLDISFNYDLRPDHPFRLHTFIVQSLVDCANSNFEESREKLESVRYFFENTSSMYLKACFYTNLAITEKELNQDSKALINFEIAIKYFSKLNNRRYLSYIENNVALTYMNLFNFPEAFAHAEKCLKVCEELQDNRQMGCVYDTLAQIAFADENYELAIDYSNNALSTLGQTETYGYLVEAYETKVKSLIKLKKIKAALSTYGDGFVIARNHTSPEITNGYTERISKLFEERLAFRIYQESGLFSTVEGMELIYPATYSVPNSVAGVEVVSSQLRSFGLEKGGLAIVDEEAAVKNGDLISIYVLQTGARLLGKLCFFENMILLEFDTDAVPVSFMRDEVKLMGKVIGYCNVLPDADGKVFCSDFVKVR